MRLTLWLPPFSIAHSMQRSPFSFKLPKIDRLPSELALRQQEYSLFKTSMDYDGRWKAKLLMGYCERRIQRVQHFEQDFTRIKGAIAHLE